jgi:hypothetical protein
LLAPTRPALAVLVVVRQRVQRNRMISGRLSEVIMTGSFFGEQLDLQQ